MTSEELQRRVDGIALDAVRHEYGLRGVSAASLTGDQWDEIAAEYSEGWAGCDYSFARRTLAAADDSEIAAASDRADSANRDSFMEAVIAVADAVVQERMKMAFKRYAGVASVAVKSGDVNLDVFNGWTV